MRDLTQTFFDGGSLHRRDYAAVVIPNDTNDGPFAFELIRFNPECFDEQGNFRPEVLVWLRALADASGETPLPFGGMA